MSAVQQYNDLIANGTEKTLAWDLATNNANDTTKNYVKGLSEGKVEVQSFSLASKAAAIGVGLLNAAINAGIALIISFAIKGINYLIHYEEKMVEKLDEAMNKFNEATSELKSLNNELETTQQRIKELQELKNAGTISVVENDELKKLQETNRELEKKIALEKIEQKNAAKEALEDAKNIKLYRGDAASGNQQRKLVDILTDIIYDKDGYDIYSDNYIDDYIYTDAIKKKLKAYRDLIDAEGKLTEEEKNEYKELEKLEELYILRNYTLDETIDSYKALSAENKRNALVLSLKNDKGIDLNLGEQIVSQLADEELEQLDPSTLTDLVLPPMSAFGGSIELWAKNFVHVWRKEIVKDVEGESEEVAKKFSSFMDYLYVSSDGVKEDLIQLAQSGKLDEKTIRSYSRFNDILEALGKTADITDDELKEMIEDINSLATKNPVDYLNNYSTELDKLSDAYIAFKKGERIDSGMLSSLQDAFGYLDSYQEFEQKVLSGNTDLQESFNAIATELAQNVLGSMEDIMDVTDGLTQETRKYYEEELKAIGIANAETVVEDALNGKQKARKKILDSLKATNDGLSESQEKIIINDYELEDATLKEIGALIESSNATEEAKEALIEYAVSKFNAAEADLTNPADIEGLVHLGKVLGVTTEKLAKFIEIKQGIEDAESRISSAKAIISDPRGKSKFVLDAALKDYNNAKKDLQNFEKEQEEAYSEYEKEIKEATKYKYNPNDYKVDIDFEFSGNDKVKEELEGAAEGDSSETFDWIETAISRIERAISKLGKVASASWRTWTERMSALGGEFEKVTSEINLQKSAFEKYMAQAQSVGLSDYYKNLVANGGLKIDEISDEALKKQINEFKEYYEKALSCADAVDDLRDNLAELAKQKFDNISKVFSDIFGIYENSKDLISKQIALFEEAGELIGEAFYQTQIDETKKQLVVLNQEKETLSKSLSDALLSGTIEKGSEAWLEMVEALNNVEGSILDAEKAIEEFDNAILKIHTETFERIQSRFDSLNSELNSLLDLLSDAEIATDDGEWTTEGLTKLGLLAQQYEIAEYRAAQYGREIDQLNADYAAGKYSTTEYADKLADLTSKQWDAISASESAKKAMLDENKARVEKVIEGIEKEKEAYKELIDERKKALQQEKDQHDWEKSVKESTDKIAKIDKQLAALRGDNSAAANAKRKKLEEKRAKYVEELEEKEYDHSAQAQQDALDKQYEDFEKEKDEEIKKENEALKDTETILARMFTAVKNNAETVGKEVETLAGAHGVKVSSTLTNSWQAGEGAIAGYGETLTTESSKFVGELTTVENKEIALQTQADATASSLVTVFSAKSTDLANSIQSASDLLLNAGTNADSLISKLQSLFGGEYGNTLTTALDGATSGAKELADALAEVDRLKKQLANEQAKNANTTSSSSEKYVQLYNSQGRAYGAPIPFSEMIKIYGNEESLKKKGYSYKVVDGYATGVHGLTKDELAWTQELGREMILSPTRNAVLTPLNAGDSVLTKEQTDNMFEWSKVNPGELLNKSVLKTITLDSTMKPMSLQIGNLVTVNGNIDDTNIKRMQTVAQNAVNDAFKKFSAGINK